MDCADWQRNQFLYKLTSNDRSRQGHPVRLPPLPSKQTQESCRLLRLLAPRGEEQSGSQVQGLTFCPLAWGEVEWGMQTPLPPSLLLPCSSSSDGLSPGT